MQRWCHLQINLGLDNIKHCEAGIEVTSAGMLHNRNLELKLQPAQ